MPHSTESNDSESRIIGRLEGGFDALQTALGELKDGQTAARLQLDAHAAEDRTYQERFAEGLGGLRDRVVRLEMGADASEGHGAAILDLEQRVSAREAVDKGRAETAAAVKANNLRWIAAGTAVGAAAGSAGTSVWPKVWGVFAGWLK